MCEAYLKLNTNNSYRDYRVTVSYRTLNNLFALYHLYKHIVIHHTVTFESTMELMYIDFIVYDVAQNFPSQVS